MNSSKGAEILSQGVGNMNLGSSDDGAWEEVCRKQKHKAGNRGAGAWGQQNPNVKAWGPDAPLKLGLRSGANTSSTIGNLGGRGLTAHGAGTQTPAPQNAQGWNRSAREETNLDREEVKAVDEDDEDEDDVYDDDDEELWSDDEEDDDGPKTHESRKKHRMLSKFFNKLDELTMQEINDAVRQWHCPACQGGPGAIDWYKGLQPLITHARTKGSKRVKLHREFADLLDEELRRRGTSVLPAGELFGQWEGLKEETRDHEIVWPPMVVIMNTRLDKDNNEKWVGMGNNELLDYFKGYAAVKARHSYGPAGHRGISLLMFDGSALGYTEAKRLHEHFLSQNTGRNDWENNKRVLFYPGGKRQLYGYLARKADLEDFNKHCQVSKTRVKYDMRSFQEMVVTKLRQMNEDNQQLTWFKNKVVKEQRNSKALQESFNVVSQKLRQTMEENRIVRQRTKLQHEQNKEEMDYQEQFFKDQIQSIHDNTVERENEFEMLQQQRRLVESSNTQASNMGDQKRRAEELLRVQEQEMEMFAAQRDELIKRHENDKMEMKKRHWNEELDLEKKLEAELTNLMAKFEPRLDAAVAGDIGA